MATFIVGEILRKYLILVQVKFGTFLKRIGMQAMAM